MLLLFLDKVLTKAAYGRMGVWGLPEGMQAMVERKKCGDSRSQCVGQQREADAGPTWLPVFIFHSAQDPKLTKINKAGTDGSQSSRS